MTSFYQQLSVYYDQIFSFDEQELDFIARQMGHCEHLLDVGCATGAKTAAFTRFAQSIVGLDSDPAMVSIAQDKHSARNVSYLLGDMQKLDAKFANESFDGLLCLGNTLVHAADADAIGRLITLMGQMLSAEGRCMLQIVNYDRIIQQNIDFLPTIETRDVSFERKYVWQGQELHFVTNLRLKATNEVLHNDVMLYPLLRMQLEAMLLNAGLGNLAWFGSYGGEQYSGNSFSTIVVAHKN